ncbi:carcinoembryonic antigen-related cell adhesion molecule 1-like [Thunnus albacares]|uniref:carcinoembryonic antigen-related cell adhesion molecule 1-like n=1 Tax=Thunnus albacares TaxID=8236 RepID=UPI001CF6F8A2|nr:carcinoembryonic antigen-related cell adhesion molecule 1-like [Thunnus albacares]XP_044214712.1 carcinoembryonic antigen-related cell adhesion molecule 1-like [Thunnus albacares]
MDILSLLCIVSVTLTGLTKGVDVLPDGPLNRAVGGTVIFNTTLTPPEKPFLAVAWSVIINNTERFIITSGSSNNTGPEYEGRITLYRSTGSLELRDVTLNDSGKYRFNIIPDGGNLITGSTELKIFERISSVNITSTDQTIEGNSVNLTCDGAGADFTREWMKDGSSLTLVVNMTLYDENRVLSFLSLKKTDSGEYLCNISNPVSFDEAKYSMVVNLATTPVKH